MGMNFQEASKTVANIDFSYVRKNLLTSGMPVERVEKSIDLYGKFLTLCAAYPDEPICPPMLADFAWHEHITDTVWYQAVCQKLVGRYLHHDPRAAGTDLFRAAWARTRALFLEHFGIELEVDPDALGSHELAPTSCAPFNCMLNPDPDLPLGLGFKIAA